MVICIHIVMNIGGVQECQRQKNGVLRHNYYFFALFGGWKINYVVTKAVFKQSLNVSVLLKPLEIKRLWVVSA